MKGPKAERFLLLSFINGCGSRSSVAVGGGGGGGSDGRRQLVKRSTVESCRFKSSFLFPKPRRFTAGFRRFINTVKKSISHQFFFYKEVDSEDEEIELEIGLPTDVKHLTHIGLDGTTTTMQPTKGWELNPSEIMSFPSVTLRQFELAMAAQTHATPPAPPPCPPPSAVNFLQRN